MGKRDVVSRFADPVLAEQVYNETVKELRQTLERDKHAPGRSEWDQQILRAALAGLRLASCMAAGMNSSRVREVKGHMAVEIAAARRILGRRSQPPDDDPPPRKKAPRKKLQGAA